jgi:hypothetical protein
MKFIILRFCLHHRSEYDCESCGEQFENINDLEEHMKKDHGRRRSFVWTEYEDMFEGKNALKTHGRRIHVKWRSMIVGIVLADLKMDMIWRTMWKG